MIKIKRVYDPPSPDDGLRFLVDRLHPRGVRKDALHIEAWLKDSAPSGALRKWFHQDASRWDEFCKRYFAELDSNPEAWRPLLEAARKGNVTLLFAARDLEHNNAAALKIYLERHLSSDPTFRKWDAGEY
ncbi:MAG: DUF488 domain-containing protein [Chloroflexota bacterium]